MIKDLYDTSARDKRRDKRANRWKRYRAKMKKLFTMLALAVAFILIFNIMTDFESVTRLREVRVYGVEMHDDHALLWIGDEWVRITNPEKVKELRHGDAIFLDKKYDEYFVSNFKRNPIMTLLGGDIYE